MGEMFNAREIDRGSHAALSRKRRQRLGIGVNL